MTEKIVKKCEEIEISKLKINNKLKNVQFLLKKEVFERMCVMSDSCSDLSMAYVPWMGKIATIKKSDGKKEDVCFLEPCAENNYADISFFDGTKYKNFKACRVRTLESVSMDGSLLTYSKGTISDSNFFVFYSVIPSEMGKILIMTAKTYEFLTSNNFDKHVRMFNINDVDKVKKAFNLSDRQMISIDFSKEFTMREDERKNASDKRNACLKTLALMKKIDERKPCPNLRTHYGLQYSAFNLMSGEIRQFRDAVARNNFFDSLNTKLSDNHNILLNCKNMRKIVDGDKVESFRANIFENGWVVCEYIADIVELAKFVKSLVMKLLEKSKRTAKKLRDIFSKAKKNFFNIVNKIIDTTIKMKFNLRKKFSFARTMKLLESVVDEKSHPLNFKLKFNNLC